LYLRDVAWRPALAQKAFQLAIDMTTPAGRMCSPVIRAFADDAADAVMRSHTPLESGPCLHPGRPTSQNRSVRIMRRMQCTHTAELGRAIIRSRVRAGLERAKQRLAAYVGRPTVGAGVEAAIRARLAAEGGIEKGARTVGVGYGTRGESRQQLCDHASLLLPVI
jgi:hypothetical protein